MDWDGDASFLAPRPAVRFTGLRRGPIASGRVAGIHVRIITLLVPHIPVRSTSRAATELAVAVYISNRAHRAKVGLAFHNGPRT